MESRTTSSIYDFIIFRTAKDSKELCKLKDFMSLLKFYGSKNPRSFSFVEGHGQLLNNLTLRENIILESIPTTLSAKNNEIQLANHIKKTGNLHLMRLFNKISLLDVYPNKIDDQSRKIVALVQGLLKDSKFLLFQSPEKFLKDEILELFIKALNFQRAAKEQTAIIHSSNEKLWLPFATQIATKSECSYQIESLVSDNAKDKFLPDSEKNVIDFPTEKSKAA